MKGDLAQWQGKLSGSAIKILMSILETKELKLNTLERIEFYATVGI